MTDNFNSINEFKVIYTLYFNHLDKSDWNKLFNSFEQYGYKKFL